MLAADGKLFVVTEEGVLYCFGGKPVRPTAAPLLQPAPMGEIPFDLDLRDTRWSRGIGVVWGLGHPSTVLSLVSSTKLHVVAIDPDRAKVEALRGELDKARHYGTRAVAHVGDPANHGLPPYFATVIVCADPVDPEHVYGSLRPYGGAAVIALPQDRRKAFEERAAALEGARVRHEGKWTWLVREGGLAGAKNYAGNWEENRDERVRVPLGVLWFDDGVGHFKRSPQPLFVDGVMISQAKNWKTSGRPYTLLPQVYSDVYTGRRLADDDPWVAGKSFPLLDGTAKQPEQYRPPTQKDHWNPGQPSAGERTNPLTGAREPRAFPKSYGCDGGVDYGHVYTMRSGTPAFYDKRLESGTVHVSGPRSGCTNSLIPACGLLNVPYFYEGCTCSYPLPVGLALVPMPATHEQWATWGPGEAAEIRRIGLNLGAPGDRMTEAGTLWLDYPAVGGPSPALQVKTEPENPDFYYRHSVWIEGGKGWPWVAASGARGLRQLVLSGLRKDLRTTVRLVFADPDHAQAGKRVFDVRIQGEHLLKDIDVAAQAGGRMRALVKEVTQVRTDGTLTIELQPKVGEPVLSGIEVVAEGLPLDAIPTLEDRSTPTLFRP
jgi:hypothetical protein